MIIIYYLKIDVPYYFYTYNYFILIFNLLPIYPLDGGRLLNLLLSILISYYNSLKKTLYLGYLIFSTLFFYFIMKNNLLIFLIFSLLGIQVLKEIKKTDYYFQKFLIERHTKNYHFSKTKQISKIKDMKKDYYHFLINNSNIIEEKEILKKYFS